MEPAVKDVIRHKAAAVAVGASSRQMKDAESKSIIHNCRLTQVDDVEGVDDVGGIGLAKR